MTATQIELNAYPIVHRHGQRMIRIVQDGAVTRDRLLLLPVPAYVVMLIAELIHEGHRKGELTYRWGFGQPPKPLSWSLS